MSNQKSIKIIFLGTPNFAAPTLKALIADERFDILAVITQPDKPVGRKQTPTPPPIKVIAEKNKILVHQPDNIKDSAGFIKNLNPDLAVLIAYGQIIPKIILDIPAYGFINIHGSLLPKYRGAACIQAAILNNDGKTGLTIMQVEPKLDTGPILKQDEIKINKEETGETLHDKLSLLGANILPDTAMQYVAGNITPQPQDNTKSSYVPTLKKQDGRIDWSKSAEEIDRLIRAMNPWPSAWTTWNKKQIKIISAFPTSASEYTPGQVFLHNQQLAIQCGQNALIIKKLQLEGKKAMTAEDFLRGQQNFIGQTLT